MLSVRTSSCSRVCLKCQCHKPTESETQTKYIAHELSRSDGVCDGRMEALRHVDGVTRGRFKIRPMRLCSECNGRLHGYLAQHRSVRFIADERHDRAIIGEVTHLLAPPVCRPVEGLGICDVEHNEYPMCSSVGSRGELSVAA
jgi:hypothetical protein